jgi:ribosome maturation factor RimP
VQSKLKNEIEELAESVLATTDFFLVGVEIKGSNTSEIWVYADSEERNINMDECAKISNELSFLMDAHEVFDGTYFLNVSSPGLSRPLVDWRQYAKNKGRRVKVKYKDAEGYHKMEGKLEALTDEDVKIGREDSAVTLPKEQIVETKIIPSLK